MPLPPGVMGLKVCIQPCRGHFLNTWGWHSQGNSSLQSVSITKFLGWKMNISGVHSYITDRNYVDNWNVWWSTHEKGRSLLPTNLPFPQSFQCGNSILIGRHLCQKEYSRIRKIPLTWAPRFLAYQPYQNLTSQYEGKWILIFSNKAQKKEVYLNFSKETGYLLIYLYEKCEYL